MELSPGDLQDKEACLAATNQKLQERVEELEEATWAMAVSMGPTFGRHDPGPRPSCRVGPG